MKLPPLVRRGAGTDAGSLPRIPPLRRPRAAVSMRALLASSWAGSAGDLPTPLLPNARRRHGGGLSLGVDLGDTRTGVAVGRGITFPLPLTVLKLRGQKLELMLLDLARQQNAPNTVFLDWDVTADELIVGLPVSADGSETQQSNKVRSVVGRLAVRAAERGLRLYLQDEFGTSIDALELMISRGVKKSDREVKSDAYAAVMILERYFSSLGQGVNIVLPRQPELQDKLIARSRKVAEIY